MNKQDRKNFTQQNDHFQKITTYDKFKLTLDV